MSDPWLAVFVVGVSAMVMKAAGPVVVGGRDLPVRVGHLVGALAPALLAAFVVTGTFASGRSLVFDERALGVAAAGLCAWLRVPLLVAVAVAALVTATARAM